MVYALIAQDFAAGGSSGVDPWALNLAVGVSVLSLVVTVTWNVVSSIINHRNSGPVIKVALRIDAHLLSEEERITAALGDEKVRTKVRMPAKKWHRSAERRTSSATLNPKLQVVVVNVGRFPTYLDQVGLGTKGRRSRSHPSQDFSLPKEIKPFETVVWETDLSLAQSWALKDGARFTRGRVMLADGKVRRSPKLRVRKAS